MIDDPVHHRIVGEEGNNAHLSPALRTGQGIDLVDFPDHLGPASAGDSWAFLLDEDEFLLTRLPLAHLAPVGIGIEPEVTDGHLSLVRDMRGDPGDELRIIHPFHLFSSFPIPVADLRFPFIEGEAFQGKERSNHVFAHSFGLFSGFGFDLAVDREAGAAPGCDLLHQDLRDELLAKEKSEDLALEELGQKAVSKLREMMESPLRVFASLGHQEVGMGMEIDLPSERLDDGHDTRHEFCNDVSRNAPGTGQGKNLGTAERNSKKSAPKAAKP